MIKHCIIRNNSIVLNGEIVFQDQGARLNDFLIKAYVALTLDYPKFYKMDSLSQAGFLASEILLRDTDIKSYSAEDVSVVLSSKQGSLDADKKYFESVKTIASPALFVYTLPNIVAGEICIRHKFKGENAFFVTDEFDVTTIGEYVDLMFFQNSPESGTPKPKACVAGWVDVLEEQHDVFLYLLENNRPALADNTVQQVRSLYNQELWNN